jgi:hypothetical protein
LALLQDQDRKQSAGFNANGVRIFPWARIGQFGPDQSVSNIGVITPIFGILILGTFSDKLST